MFDMNSLSMCKLDKMLIIGHDSHITFIMEHNLEGFTFENELICLFSLVANESFIFIFFFWFEILDFSFCTFVSMRETVNLWV